MGLCGVSDLVDHFHSGIHSGIVADSILSAGDVVVNSTGKAYTRYTLGRKISRTSEGAVAADDNNAVKTHFDALVFALLHALRVPELRTSCSIKTGAASLYDPGNDPGVHFDDLAVEKTVVASADTYDLHTSLKSSSANSPYSGIHTGGVAAASQNTDFLCHVIYLQLKAEPARQPFPPVTRPHPHQRQNSSTFLFPLLRITQSP